LGENKFVQWFNEALEGKDLKARQQYYPDQTLLAQGTQRQRSVNLSINTIADASDPAKVRGALVVMEDISDEKRLKSTMYRYMTQELAEELLKLDDAKLGGDRKEVSVLFSDIRSYTALTEKLSAEEVVGMLNDYFETMVEAIFRHKGTLDKYIGDAIMAVFGSPLPLTDHAWRAVQTSVEMRHRLAEFNTRRLAVGREPIKIGIGINSDSVISGNIGSSKRMEFTAIGDGVNLGSRLESASKLYGCDIIISQYTFQPCADKIWYRELDWIRVKGKNEPVKIYELVDLRSESISEHKQQVIELYHKGREYFLKRQFRKAWMEFATIVDEVDPDDKSAKLQMERSQHFVNTPPPEDWDGVWTLTEK
ncbi:MAG: adenylate/guanylate cyclase domain-containing protein, partial [Coleofasciculus sp. S288]|nr:adenylate/guanylate cyclase domain-containing protein [Coleofasciculus sp. S288]